MAHAHTGLGDIAGHRFLKLFPSISKVDQQGITHYLLVSAVIAVYCSFYVAFLIFKVA